MEYTFWSWIEVRGQKYIFMFGWTDSLIYCIEKIMAKSSLTLQYGDTNMH